MEEYIEAFKRKKRQVKVPLKESKSINWHHLLSKVLLSIIFFLISIIFINLDEKNLFLYKEYVFTESLPFIKIKNWYEDLFGEVLPKEENSKTVFNGKLIYKDIEDYLDGSKLKVSSNALINNITSGIVVFIGEKEGYGNTVIIQGSDNADIWYGNLTNVSVKLYDYIEKDTVIGEVNGEDLYLVINKNNEYLKYEDYQNQ